ncbi:MAG: peptidylprolyl isomerase [Planctomycetes bacterium]|nr:peptidylprolyl isomerase [Planctomycetota bacterium]
MTCGARRIRLRTRALILVPAVVAWCAALPGVAAPGEPSVHPRVQFKTTHGDFVLELDGEKAPRTVANFARYVEDRFYDGTVFHRVLKGKLIQGGVYTGKMEPRSDGLRDGIGNEASGLTNARGTIAMYRELGRPGSAAAEFYINLSENHALDKALDGTPYTVFGRVVEGMESVDRIGGVAVGTHPAYAAGRSHVVPRAAVVIRSASLLAPVDLAALEARAAAIDKERDAADRAPEQNAAANLMRVVADLEKETGRPLIQTPSGLRYADLRTGKGGSPTEEDKIELNFRGMLADGTILNDTFEDPEPAVKRVGELIRGLREGVTSMGEGGRRVFIVPPELAFGEDGVAGRIPPNATLIFEVDLLRIMP